MSTSILHSPYTSLSSDQNTPITDQPCSTSTSRITNDDEVMLASKNPKKRAGRKKFRETRHPVYRGIRQRDSGKWVCEVRQPNKKSRLWLGTYATADMAARANDVAVLALRGRSACLNFADSVWRLPVPASSSVKDIQIAALKAAEMFGLIESVIVEIEERCDELLPEDVFNMDYEVIFGMPGIVANMAEGLLMVPPPGMVEFDTCQDDVEFCLDASLWSF